MGENCENYHPQLIDNSKVGSPGNRLLLSATGNCRLFLSGAHVPESGRGHLLGGGRLFYLPLYNRGRHTNISGCAKAVVEGGDLDLINKAINTKLFKVIFKNLTNVTSDYAIILILRP